MPGGDGPSRLGQRGRGALPGVCPGRRTGTRGVGAGQPPASPPGRVPRVRFSVAAAPERLVRGARRTGGGPSAGEGQRDRV